MARPTGILRLALVVAVVGLAVVAYIVRPAARSAAPAEDTARTVVAPLPRLLDLGADKCVPCKMMAPILTDLARDLAGQLTVDFIDVWQDPAAAEPYKIRVIPTQIFFAGDGTELFRHEGFYSREDILGKWRELGVTLTAAGT